MIELNVEMHGTGTQCEKVRSMIRITLSGFVKPDLECERYKFLHGLMLDMSNDKYLKIYPTKFGNRGKIWSNYTACVSYDDITDVSYEIVKGGFRPVNMMIIFLKSESDISSQIHLYFRV